MIEPFNFHVHIAELYKCKIMVDLREVFFVFCSLLFGVWSLYESHGTKRAQFKLYYFVDKSRVHNRCLECLINCVNHKKISRLVL